MGNDVKPLQLNLGCGAVKEIGWVNVDAYGDPDVVWDLNVFPYPWEENSVDHIQAKHVFEHLDDWWGAFVECARIVKPGGTIRIHVPDESSTSAGTYRDHLSIITPYSFIGIIGENAGTNAWAEQVKDSVPVRIESYQRAPFKKYNWMMFWCPWLLKFCAEHLRNFIWEQQFVFRKIT